MTNINVYVGDDEKIHFTDSAGADTVLPFSKGTNTMVQAFSSINNSHSNMYGSGVGYISNNRIYTNYNVTVLLSLDNNANNAFAYVNGVEKFGTYSAWNYYGHGTISMSAGEYLYYSAPYGGTIRGICVLITK